MVDDHRHHDALTRTVWGRQYFFSLERHCKVVYFKGNVRHGLDDLWIRRIRVEAHPLNATGAGLKSRNVQLELWQILFPRVRRESWNAHVVVAPAFHGNRRWSLAVLPPRDRHASRISCCVVAQSSSPFAESANRSIVPRLRNLPLSRPEPAAIEIVARFGRNVIWPPSTVAQSFRRPRETTLKGKHP